MRIISGQAGGITIKVPSGIKVRPTAARTRQALFNSLGDISGTAILDLFAGSGALGLEAASRGAEKVVFVEKNYRHCRIIEENIAKVTKSGVNCEFRVIKNDVREVIQRNINTGPLNFIFADPPYIKSLEYLKVLTTSEEFLAFAGQAQLIWELPQNLPNQSGFADSGLWKIEKRRTFGKIEFLFLRKKE